MQNFQRFELIHLAMEFASSRLRVLMTEHFHIIYTSETREKEFISTLQIYPRKCYEVGKLKFIKY